jgi:hypothetical protein
MAMTCLAPESTSSALTCSRLSRMEKVTAICASAAAAGGMLAGGVVSSATRAAKGASAPDELKRAQKRGARGRGGGGVRLLQHAHLHHALVVGARGERLRVVHGLALHRGGDHLEEHVPEHLNPQRRPSLRELPPRELGVRLRLAREWQPRARRVALKVRLARRGLVRRLRALERRSRGGRARERKRAAGLCGSGGHRRDAAGGEVPGVRAAGLAWGEGTWPGKEVLVVDWPEKGSFAGE